MQLCIPSAQSTTGSRISAARIRARLPLPPDRFFLRRPATKRACSAFPTAQTKILNRITKAMKSSTKIAGTLALLALLSSSRVQAAAVIQSVGGNATAASITAARDAFRLDLGGGTVAGANGSFGGVRREINWDGVPATFSAPNNLPGNFFNSNSPRGAVFSTPGTGFQVSGAASDAGAGQPAAANFGNINATYGSTFGVFTAQRIFTALGSNITDVNFFVAGTTTIASVRGFGAVFTDVDINGSTTLQFFDLNNSTLGTFTVAAGSVASQSLSFLGVSFTAGEQIGRVRITSGNAALTAALNDGGITDLVAMDDFIYSEPVAAVAVPEPGNFLTGAGVIFLLAGSQLLGRKRSRQIAV